MTQERFTATRYQGTFRVLDRETMTLVQEGFPLADWGYAEGLAATLNRITAERAARAA